MHWQGQWQSTGADQQAAMRLLSAVSRARGCGNRMEGYRSSGWEATAQRRTSASEHSLQIMTIKNSRCIRMNRSKEPLSAECCIRICSYFPIELRPCHTFCHDAHMLVHLFYLSTCSRRLLLLDSRRTSSFSAPFSVAREASVDLVSPAASSSAAAASKRAAHTSTREQAAGSGNSIVHAAPSAASRQTGRLDSRTRLVATRCPLDSRSPRRTPAGGIITSISHLIQQARMHRYHVLSATLLPLRTPTMTSREM
jgi:hypothetical protein